ncbi:intermembrane phospholipid transport protein YdbH family protein [Candidatus Nitrospira salsa]
MSDDSDKQETVTIIQQRRFWWWLLGLAILPVAAYGCFPWMATTALTEGLKQHGFRHVSIQLGYPTTQTLTIHKLAFEKDLAEETYQGTFKNIKFEYHLSQLFNGHVSQITIESGDFIIKPASAISTTEKERNGPSSSQDSSFTTDELLSPLPMLPFEQLLVGDISIDHTQATDPLQHILVAGTVDARNQELRTHFNIQGANIPDYEITLSGTSIGDLNLVILSPASTPPTLARITSQATRIDQTLQLQGSLNIDIPNVLKLAELFVSVEHDLSQMTGNIAAEWNGTIPHSVTINSLVKEKTGTINGTFQIRAALPQLKTYGQNIDVKANGTFAATHNTVTWTLAQESEVSSHVRVAQLQIPEPARAIIPLNGHRLFIDFSKPLSGQIDLKSQPPVLRMNGLIHTRYSIENFPIDLQFSLTQMTGSSIQNLSAKGTYFFSGTVGKQLEPYAPIKQLTWKLSGEASFENEALTASLTPQSSLHMTMLPINDLLVPQTDVIFLKKFTGSYHLKNQRWETNPLVLKINTPQISWEDKTLSIQNTKLSIHELNGSLSTWQSAGQIVLLGMATTIQDVTPPTTHWKFRFSANPESLLVNLLGQTSDTQVSIYGRLHQDLLTQQGHFHMKLAPITFSPSAFNLRTSIKPWAYPLDITTGQISGKAEASWMLPRDTDKKSFSITQAKADINIDRLGGHYENIIFDELSTKMAFVGADTWAMPSPASLTLAKLETGVSISNLSMNFQLNPISDSIIPRVEISRFSADMFEGKISGDDFTFDSSEPRQQLRLHAQGLDIGAILNLEQQEGLQGTGLIDGTIPATLTEKGVEVHNGRLAARPPGGIIRYRTAEGTAETLKQTSENMNLVLQALNNFHYDELTIGADYDHNGKLMLATKIKGKNPDLHQGKPIHFNLNVEENIPALLQSLQVAKDIEGKIEELLQRSEENLLEGL